MKVCCSTVTGLVSPFLCGEEPSTEPLGKFLLSFRLLKLGEISVTGGHVFGCGYNVGVNDACMIDGCGGKILYSAVR